MNLIFFPILIQSRLTKTSLILKSGIQYQSYQSYLSRHLQSINKWGVHKLGLTGSYNCAKSRDSFWRELAPTISPRPSCCDWPSRRSLSWGRLLLIFQPELPYASEHSCCNEKRLFVAYLNIYVLENYIY